MEISETRIMCLPSITVTGSSWVAILCCFKIYEYTESWKVKIKNKFNRHQCYGIFCTHAKVRYRKYSMFILFYLLPFFKAILCASLCYPIYLCIQRMFLIISVFKKKKTFLRTFPCWLYITAPMLKLWNLKHVELNLVLQGQWTISPSRKLATWLYFF